MFELQIRGEANALCARSCILARPESWELLLESLDDARTLKAKKKKLLAALFLIVSDHLSLKRNDPAVLRRVLAALRERNAVIAELGTRHIGRHIGGSIVKRVTAAIATTDRP